MKNPLNKRIPREFKSDIGKYAVIFLFMVMLISLVSGFLVTDDSVYTAYKEGFEKYNLEWGHFTLSNDIDDEFIEELSDKGEVEIYDLDYFEEYETNGAKIRVYRCRDEVNLECVMSGSLPVNANEIALDRMYAKNAGYEVGDTISIKDKELTITGLIAIPDYSCLFENNSDMMFDSINFSVAVMTSEGYDAVGSTKQFYNYAWKYKIEPADEKEEKEMSDKLIDAMQEVGTEYAQKLYAEQGADAELLEIDDYVPRYNNQAINFTGDDMGGDKAMFLMLCYIVIAIIAFVFAITISNTITQEAGVIGTLRASGYTKGELVRHYMVLPVIVTIVAAIIGNVLGYTWLKKYFVDLYYNSYSLCTYKTLWNAEAFIDTTIVPVILMFIINLFVLIYKMQFSPLDFLRRNLKKKNKKKAFRLNTRIPFIHRFRMRIIFQNIPNYIVLFIGIQLAALIAVFGKMMVPLMDDYADKVEKSMIADYQYVLKTTAETDNSQAEKYCLTELETVNKKYMTDTVSVYGIFDDSAYITADIPTEGVLVSSSVMNKFGYKTGDTITLKEEFTDDTYDFVIAGEYSYEAALAVFMSREEYLETFGKAENYFTGYFSNEELDDIAESDVAAVVTLDDMTKVSRQLKVSMGDMMGLYSYFGGIMFILLMYVLSKQIIEKNGQSISMTKILGFNNGEIGGLYIVATSIVVLLSLIVAIPISDLLLRLAFRDYLYTQMTGYIPYSVNHGVFVFMFLMGVVCYVFVAFLQLLKIKKIPMSDALKNLE